MSDLTLALDIYGTLVNPLEMDEHLREFAGSDAPAASALWRQKQLEYTFRRGLMRSYTDFGTVTAQALEFASKAHGLDLDKEQMATLISEYQNLRAFPDVKPGLEALGAAGIRLVAFSNGVQATTRKLLENAGVMEYLDDVVSVDDVKTFKPAPEVYGHLCRTLNQPSAEIRLVSSNPFDVIGAKSFGLQTAWLQRNPEVPFDPWGITPDLIASDLLDLAGHLTEHPNP
uniref:haloacid dehalogenase type II n=1 Tax=Rubrobacter indicoceani TaxID=2051957 RepID=UPI001F091D79|nr:haloacid dehalogenase type II [Rubrobacter indicoceani]